MSSARDYLAEREESREWARRTVEKHAPLVNRIARHLLARMPANVQIDDLVQSGMIGLLDAAKKYDHTKGASFETYAGIRIQGASEDPQTILQSLERDPMFTEVAPSRATNNDQYYIDLRLADVNFEAYMARYFPDR